MKFEFPGFNVKPDEGQLCGFSYASGGKGSQRPQIGISEQPQRPNLRNIEQIWILTIITITLSEISLKSQGS